MRPTFPLLLAALLMTASASRAQDAPASADFDYYLLSLSLAPGFCALSPRNAAKDECRSLTATDVRTTPLTIHGLWPNRARVSTNRQPHDCDGPPLDRLSEPVQSALRRYMPAGPGLERYEWSKHGTCSGLPPDTYFADEVRLAQHANETLGQVLSARIGQTVGVADLIAAAAARDPALGPAIVVDCQQPRGGGPAVIAEIRITLAKDLTPIPAASVGLGQNSGCPRGAGLVADVPG